MTNRDFGGRHFRRKGKVVSRPAVLAILLGAAGLTTLGSEVGGQNAMPDIVISGLEGYISGVVESPDGPEAGVWVIAETTDLSTPYVKIVVTNDEGRFVLPELPMVNFHVWVRGYGLVDSEKVYLRPGDHDVRLDALVAGSPNEAAQVYPADHWFALLEPPRADEFPGTGPEGNGLGPSMQTQSQWIDALKLGCNFCHQLGNQVTRTLDHWWDHPDYSFQSMREVWEHRIGVGVRGQQMAATAQRMGQRRTMEVLTDWTERIAAGEVPPAPRRPQGIERNAVVTLWDWGTETSYMHDEITTDKRDPTVNAGGPVYAVSSGHGKLTVLDPATHHTWEIVIPTRDPVESIPTRFPPPNRPSAFWGDSHLWGPEQPSDPHNPMFDSQGRVWLTSAIRAAPNPDRCRDGALNRFAEYFPIQSAGRHASYYDPTTGEFELIDTCFTTHHLQFAYDADDTLWFNPLGGPGYLGWLNTRMYDETGDEWVSQGWCPLVLDTTGDGRISRPWNEPDDDFDPSRDTRVGGQVYGVQPSPAAGEEEVVWGSITNYPGYLVRLIRGNDPPATCVTERFRVPAPGFGPRGLDVDSHGVVWTALAGSSQMASFDRRKCTTLNGPDTRDGDHCPEGWTVYPTDGPAFQGTEVPADFQYYNWNDTYNASGLGADRPWAPGGNSDALLMLDPETGQWHTFRVPYPLGFYQRLLDGRIDDPDAGWKGRGLWANFGTHFPWHIEGGKGTKGKMVKFQFRPDPLAY